MRYRINRAMLRESLENDDQLLVHAVGDQTAESFMDAMEAEGADWKNRRVRVEHGDGMLPDLIPRARDLGVVVVQNPSHFAFRDIFVARYGRSRLSLWLEIATSTTKMSSF